MHYIILFLAVAALSIAVSCGGTTKRSAVDVDFEPVNGTAVLNTAKQEWPEDTSGGIAGTGRTLHIDESSDIKQLEAQAEHGALLRILANIRARDDVENLHEGAFLSCMEQYGQHIYVKREELPSGRQEITVFLPKEIVAAVIDCMKR